VSVHRKKYAIALAVPAENQSSLIFDRTGPDVRFLTASFPRIGERGSTSIHFYGRTPRSSPNKDPT
jgi:hypothetical protein